MSNFFSELGHTRVYAETYFSYVAGEDPRRTPLRGKRAIYGWKLARQRSLKVAIAHFSEALRLKSDYEKAPHNLQLAVGEAAENKPRQE